MNLPSSWVDRIFAKLIVAYGHRFLGQYSGVSVDVVKADWAEKLGAYCDRPDAIQYALDLLPADNPPNVLQFRELCRKAPAPAAPMLPAPAQDPARVAKALSGLQRPVAMGAMDAHIRLAQREQAGEKLTITQRHMWRDAFRLSHDTTPADFLATLGRVSTAEAQAA